MSAVKTAIPDFDPRWEKLLSPERIGREIPDQLDDSTRGPFDRDYDRIVHSSNFRRLKDKTQVFPLSPNDFVRTRLTHSLEVSCIGRTLGRRVQFLLGKWDSQELDLGSIVAAASLAHDIGNPPFGHSGEFAIQEWAKRNVGARTESDSDEAKYFVSTLQERQDLHDFDGNAQSLRVVTRIQARRRNGGMQLTLATLGSMMKYPCGSLIDGKARDRKHQLDQKKCGFFDDDKSLVVEALTRLGLKKYASDAFRRHPLAYLVEAADDISNAIVDLEDTVDQRIISAKQSLDLLSPLASRVSDYVGRKYDSDEEEVERLRAYATFHLTAECSAAFIDNLDAILDGTFNQSLIDTINSNAQYDAIRKAIEGSAFTHPSVLETEVAGFRVIDGLLNAFIPAIVHNECDRTKEEKKILGLIPIGYLRQPGKPEEQREIAVNRLTTYQRILAVTDYISGMTDGFAVELYQKLSGIRLPS